MTRGRLGSLGALALMCACAPALRTPPSLEELGGGEGPPLSRAQAEDDVRRAETRFAERRPAAVREAARMWTTAARYEGPWRLDAFVGALRARIWLAGHVDDPEARRRESTAAVQTGQWCQRVFPDEPRCDYWLGAALGVQARERRATALDALPRIVELFTRARDRAPLLDEAGPDRALALVYLRAPGWPSGPGDHDAGLDHARRAVELRPGYPPNQLALAEALAATGDPGGARRAYERAMALASEAESRGEPEAGEWAREAEHGLARRTGRADEPQVRP